jgi:hypothetical protein
MTALQRETDMHTHEMIAAHPHVRGSVNDVLSRCIDACHDCAQACTSCADACLGEKSVAELTQCIRLNLDCADLCDVTAAVATRRTGSNEGIIKRMLEVCAEACRICGEECARHASKHEHCRICADACKRCEGSCRDASETIKAAVH